MGKIKLTNLWLKADQVNDGDVVKIVGEHIERSAEDTPFGRATIELPVELPSGADIQWTVNKTTIRRLMKAWGDNSKNWIGKKVRIQKVKQNVRGNMKDVLYGTPVTEET